MNGKTTIMDGAGEVDERKMQRLWQEKGNLVMASLL
jgi:hypothetical protein